MYSSFRHVTLKTASTTPSSLFFEDAYRRTEHMFIRIYADDLLRHARLQDSCIVDQDALDRSARFFAETCEVLAVIDDLIDDLWLLKALSRAQVVGGCL